jgi:hypothetical protein
MKMAYVSQELKAKIAPKIKEILKRYGIRGSLSVRHHSTLVLNIREGALDLIGNSNETCAADPYQVANGVQPSVGYMDVNPYHYGKHFSGKSKRFLDEVMRAMNAGNWDRSDVQTDYFDRGWYVDINIGRWDKPYKLVK